jgi:hypothetical protein
MIAMECETIELCAQWVTNEDVRAMLVPHSDFITFQLSSALKRKLGATGTECGSQFRVVGDPLLADDRYTAPPHLHTFLYPNPHSTCLYVAMSTYLFLKSLIHP